jgi:hypothetical protein
MTWTWTAPSGEKFTGSVDYIEGARAGWEARAWTPDPPRPRCKFSSLCEHVHPDDITTHTDGGTW